MAPMPRKNSIRVRLDGTTRGKPTLPTSFSASAARPARGSNTVITRKCAGNLISPENLYTCELGSRSAIRIVRIVKATLELGMENVRWFAMAGDDTVFFTENLVTVLVRYDHDQMYYIGGKSERVEQNVVHSYIMAYSGGGFAISDPLAAELVRVLDGCLDRYASLYGFHEKMQACLTEIDVRITRELVTT
ncbi:Protein of unknown function DUF604 [Dillenia turbinata]|uniref:Uncharacterized protein n=1 Tax=Dillenia turbinata TaxID=194707 RepID=A0AAN8VZ11_9MAGN